VLYVHLQKAKPARKLVKRRRIAVDNQSATSNGIETRSANSYTNMSNAFSSLDAGMHADRAKLNIAEHSYSLSQCDSLRKLKQKLAVTERENCLRLKLKMTKQKCRRLKKKVSNLLQVVSNLEDEKLVTPNAADVLKSSFSGIPQELMSRMLKNSKNGTITRSTYSPVLRTFALTLSFYSAKA
jgi:hypothetical protein